MFRIILDAQARPALEGTRNHAFYNGSRELQFLRFFLDGRNGTVPHVRDRLFNRSRLHSDVEGTADVE
nr:hypothetical protein [Paenibacillus thiaminolyticus]